MPPSNWRSARHIRLGTQEQRVGFQSLRTAPGPARALSNAPNVGASSSWFIEAIVATILLGLAIGLLQCAVNRWRQRATSEGPMGAADPRGPSETAPKALHLSEAQRRAALEEIYAGHCRRATDLLVLHKPTAQMGAQEENTTRLPDALQSECIRTETEAKANAEETKQSTTSELIQGTDLQTGCLKGTGLCKIIENDNVDSFDPESALSVAFRDPSRLTEQKGKRTVSPRIVACPLHEGGYDAHGERCMDKQTFTAKPKHAANHEYLTSRMASSDHQLPLEESRDFSGQLASNAPLILELGECSVNDGVASQRALLVTMGLDCAFDAQSCASEANVCPICLCDYLTEDALITSKHCAHLFHKDCVLKWLQQHDECPICRTSMVTELELNQAATALMGKARLCRAVASKHSREVPRSASPSLIDGTPPTVREAIVVRAGGAGRRSLSLVPKLWY